MFRVPSISALPTGRERVLLRAPTTPTRANCEAPVNISADRPIACSTGPARRPPPKAPNAAPYRPTATPSPTAFRSVAERSGDDTRATLARPPGVVAHGPVARSTAAWPGCPCSSTPGAGHDRQHRTRLLHLQRGRRRPGGPGASTSPRPCSRSGVAPADLRAAFDPVLSFIDTAEDLDDDERDVAREAVQDLVRMVNRARPGGPIGSAACTHEIEEAARGAHGARWSRR